MKLKRFLENSELIDDQVDDVFNGLNKRVRWDKLLNNVRFRTFLSGIVNFIVMNGYFIVVSDESKKKHQ